MKASSVKIDVDTVLDEMTNWKNKVDDYCSNRPTVKDSSSDGFAILKDAGFSDESFNTFDSNINESSFSIQDFYKMVSEYLLNMKNTDTEVESKVPSPSVVEYKATSSSFTVSEQSTSNMGDLSKEAKALKNSNTLGYSNYNDTYQGVTSENLVNVNNSTATESEYKDNTVNEKTVVLEEMKDNKSFESAYDSNTAVLSQNLSNINKDNTPYEVSYDSTSSLSPQDLSDAKTDNSYKVKSLDELHKIRGEQISSQKDLINKIKSYANVGDEYEGKDAGLPSPNTLAGVSNKKI